MRDKIISSLVDISRVAATEQIGKCGKSIKIYTSEGDTLTL